MDQVRNIARIIWQQRFWVLSVLGVIVAVICWKMGASAIDAQTATNKSAIETEFGAMQKIATTQYMGNDAVNEVEFQETSKIRDKVVELWEKMYASQRDQVLKWPPALGEEFLTYVENKKFRDPITDPDMLQIYREYAKERFPKLVEIVDAQKMAAGAVGGFGDGRMAMGGRDGAFGGGAIDPNDPNAQEKYLVRWFDQGTLRQQLEFTSLPTSLKVWVTQEDLWVYETLLHAIAEVNEERGATRPDNTAIADIMALEVGRAAAMQFKQPGVIMMPVAPMAGDGAELGRGGEEMGMPMGDGRGGEFGAAVDPDAGLLALRYIGDDGQPITDEAAAVDPAAQFRRLPVRMLLKIEQTAVPNLLAACANATLPVEVKRVRINSEKSESGATMSAAMPSGGGGGREGAFGGGGMGMGRPSGGGYGGREGAFGGGGRGMEGGAMMASPDGMERKELATVEIHGIVYIYNPPDAATLTVPGGPPESVAAAESSDAVAVQ